MKRLLTLLAATASLALVADPFVDSGTGFEQMTVADTNLDVAALNTSDANDVGEWAASANASTIACKVAAYSEGVSLPNRPAKAATAESNSVYKNASGANANYLSVDTGSDELLRNIVTGGAAQTIGTEGIYFDSLVQFTASDDDPTVTSGDKLLVWLKGDGETTNLVVTAGAYDSTTESLVATHYSVTVPGISQVEAGVWYRLTIAALENKGYNNVTAGFKVYLTAATAGAATLTTASPVFAADNQTVFSSMVNDGTVKNALTAVGFKGTGAIDDLVFTTTDPFPVEEEKYFQVGDDTDKQYASFTEAVTAAGASGTVKVIADYETSTALSVSGTLTLDLYGHTITNTVGGSAITIASGGVLTIIDSAQGGGGVVAGSPEGEEEEGEEEEDPEEETSIIAINNSGTVILGTSANSTIPTIRDSVFVQETYTVKYYGDSQPSLSVVDGEGTTLTWSNSADTDGYYTITSGGSDDSGDSVTISGSEVTGVTVEADKITVTTTSRVESSAVTTVKIDGVTICGDDFTKAFSVTVGGEGAVTLTLKQPAFSVTESVTTPWTESGGDKVTLNTPVIVGLYYAVASGTDVTTLTAPEKYERATESNKDTILQVAKPDGATGFFRVYVSLTGK